MSKKDVFIVFGEEKATLAEVIEILGTKVKLKDIKAGKVEGVSIKEVEVDDTAEDSLESKYTEKQLATAREALEHVNSVRAEQQDEATKEVATTETPVDETVEKEDTKEEDATPVDETPEGTWEVVEDELNKAGEIPPTDTPEDKKEVPPTDTPEDKKDIANMSMAEKMARLAELHAKKTADSTDGKKGKGSKVVFDGTFPEVGSLKDEKDLKKMYKQLTNEQLDEWMSLEGLEYNVNANESINRMRKCMAITALHFPKTPSTKNKSKYAEYTNEQLIEMAINAELDIKDHKGDNRILRMYLIMALKEAGLIAK